MSQKEIDLIQKYLLIKKGTMLEWGCGGSTLYFSKFTRHYFSIEHSPEWASKIREEIYKEKRTDINLVHVNNSRHFLDYICYPSNLNLTYDFILIDGRFRVACAVKALEYLSEDGIVFFHDFSARDYYWHTLNYYDVIAEINDGQTLAILKKKIT